MKKETRGRKPSKNPASERIEFRVTPEQKAKYEKASEKLNKSVSEWFKDLGDKNS